MESACDGAHPHGLNGLVTRCSICAAISHDGSAEAGRRRAATLPRTGGLDASFVNVPRSRHPPTHAGGGTALERNVRNIDAILDEALRSGDDDADGGGRDPTRRGIVTGADMHDASRRTDAFLEAAMTMLRGEGDQNVYCRPCVDRIGAAIDTCSEQLEEQHSAYDRAATAEEERTLLLSNVLSMNSDIDDICDNGDDAIRGVIDSFQHELDALANACAEQTQELRLLQSLLRDQHARSTAISDREESAFLELNALDVAANACAEEQRLAGDRCAAAEAELVAASRVALLAVPCVVRAQDAGRGRYPTINGLRLAYRASPRAGLRREEIDAAFSGAARLVALALGRRGGGGASALRVVPTHPRARILVTLPEGQSVHELGIETASQHVPVQSLRLFLVLLSQLSADLIADRNRSAGGTSPPPPFPMMGSSIDGIDVAQLAESNTTAWSSVIFSIATNLRWLSELEIGQPRV